MNFITAIFDLFSKNDISIPIGQLALFLTINSLCLLFGKHKMGLLISYCFVFYWGFILNKELLLGSFGNGGIGMTVYILAGLVMFVSVIIGFTHKND